ncbi:MAG: PilZ domain-containing protein [Myxococcota bacterium]
MPALSLAKNRLTHLNRSPRRLPRPRLNRRFVPRVAQPFGARALSCGTSLHGIDLSFGGMKCCTDKPVWPGNFLEMELVLKNGESVLVKGPVVELLSHQGNVAMRVRFEGIDDQARQAIATWMAGQAMRAAREAGIRREPGI